MVESPGTVQTTCADAGDSPPAIRLAGIGKSFAAAGDGLEVLTNINLTVAAQSIVGGRMPGQVLQSYIVVMQDQIL
ncbi:MAG: hypothetical protein WD688_14975 [Candidatus Binatia bacterium]